METSPLVLGQTPGCLAVDAGSRGLGVRLQPGAVLPELHGSPRGTLHQHGAPAPVRRERPAPLARFSGAWQHRSGRRRWGSLRGISYTTFSGFGLTELVS